MNLFSCNSSLQFSQNTGYDLRFFLTLVLEHEDYLIIEDANMEAQRLKANEIKEFLVKSNKNIQLAVILSCHSESIGNIFINCGISHVICIKRDEEIKDMACLIFTRAFYSALFDGIKQSVCEAYQHAICVLTNSQKNYRFAKEEAKKFMLLHKNGTVNEHSVECWSAFIHTLEGDPLNDTHQPAICELPERDLCFMGRENDVISIFKKLKKNHLWLTGEHGIGKSSIVKKLAHMVYDRNIYPGGVLYLCLQDCHDFMSLVELLFLTVFNSLTNKVDKLKLGKNKNTEISQKYRACIDAIKELKLLLILDNCDTYMSDPENGFERFVQDLKEKMLESSIIITSREGVHYEGILDIKKIDIQQIDNPSVLSILCSKIGGNPELIIKWLKDQCLEEGIISKDQRKEKDEIPKWLFQHELFNIINGNPLCAILVASLASGKSRWITNRMIIEWCIQAD